MYNTVWFVSVRASKKTFFINYAYFTCTHNKYLEIRQSLIDQISDADMSFAKLTELKPE